MTHDPSWAFRAVLTGYAVPVVAWLAAMALAATSSSNAAFAAMDALMVGGSGAGIVCYVAAAILASARWSRERVSRLRSAALVVAALFGVLLLVPVFHWHVFKPE